MAGEIGSVSIDWGQMGRIRHHPGRKKLRISSHYGRTVRRQDVGSAVEMVDWIPGLGHKDLSHAQNFRAESTHAGLTAIIPRKSKKRIPPISHKCPFSCLDFPERREISTSATGHGMTKSRI
jgi:hypothetical protein